MKQLSIFASLFSYLLCFLLILSGCSGLQKDTDERFFAQFAQIAFDPNVVATNITMRNTQRLDTNVTIIIIDYIIVNSTGRELAFSVVANPQVFIFDAKDNTWHIQENRVGHYNLSPQDCSPIEGVSDLGICGFGVYTEITSQNLPATIRVVTIGDVMQNNEPTGEQLGVFFDVEIPSDSVQASVPTLPPATQRAAYFPVDMNAFGWVNE
ncbi:MAG: hypothetical protein OHK0052_21730 [Anaerolineales bacterium]